MEEILGNEFTWFMGVVEDRNDPLKLGRVRVRCYHWHTDDTALLPTDKLPWAQPLCPITNGASQNIGETPLGMQIGTWVVGFFMDGKLAQKPMIMGTIAGIPGAEPDMHRLARNDSEFPPLNPVAKDVDRTTSVSVANSTDTWNEPQSAYNAQYPFNKVMETESGHIKEFDDTPNNQRIHEFHTSGTFYEIDVDGNKVVRVVGDNYEIVAGSKYLNVKGDANLTINGSLKLKSDDLQIESDTGLINIGSGSIVIGSGDVQASGISLTTHTHTDPAGIAGAQTSTPN